MCSNSPKRADTFCLLCVIAHSGSRLCSRHRFSEGNGPTRFILRIRTRRTTFRSQLTHSTHDSYVASLPKPYLVLGLNGLFIVSIIVPDESSLWVMKTVHSGTTICRYLKLPVVFLVRTWFLVDETRKAGYATCQRKRAVVE